MAKIMIDVDEVYFEKIKVLAENGNELAQVVANSTVLPETNGEVIKAMFPGTIAVEKTNRTIACDIFIKNNLSFCSYFDKGWWNSSYKVEGEE